VFILFFIIRRLNGTCCNCGCESIIFVHTAHEFCLDRGLMMSLFHFIAHITAENIRINKYMMYMFIFVFIITKVMRKPIITNQLFVSRVSHIFFMNSLYRATIPRNHIFDCINRTSVRICCCFTWIIKLNTIGLFFSLYMFLGKHCVIFMFSNMITK
jgi:hypothetical protein